MIKTAEEGIQVLHLFPTHTAESYKAATGEDAPPFDPTRQPKLWFDPAAKTSARQRIVYDRVPMMATSGFIEEEGGQPLFEPLVLNREIAATVNIPDRAAEIRDANEGGKFILKPAVPVPMRALEPGEVFAKHGMSLKWMVRNVALFTDKQLQVDNFMVADRELLKAIAKKIGLEVS